MNVQSLYEAYKEAQPSKKIILANFMNDTGYVIENLHQFKNMITASKGNELLITNEHETDTEIYYEYFPIHKVEGYITIFKHPMGTNAYWKVAPDEILDQHPAHNGDMYYYVRADYAMKMKEFVIECPQFIKKEVMTFFKETFPKFPKSDDKQLSIIVSNSSRFLNIKEKNVLNYDIDGEEWGLKKPTLQNISQKIWQTIRTLDATID